MFSTTIKKTALLVEPNGARVFRQGNDFFPLEKVRLGANCTSFFYLFDGSDYITYGDLYSATGVEKNLYLETITEGIQAIILHLPRDSTGILRPWPALAFTDSMLEVPQVRLLSNRLAALPKTTIYPSRSRDRWWIMAKTVYLTQ